MQFTYRRGTTGCTSSQLWHIYFLTPIPCIQILKAVSRKLTIAADVDFSEISNKTEGFSGADLQALLYNAQLEVVHSTISDSETLDVGYTPEQTPLEYVVISEGKSVMTKEEEGALERRVGYLLDL